MNSPPGLTSAAVPVTVDVTRPCVLASSLRLPQDINMDGRLNGTELGAAAPRLEFQLDPACGDMNLTTLSATPVVVREVVSNVVSTTALNVAGDVSFDMGMGRVRVDLTQGIVAERDYTFFVELQDLLLNRNTFTATMNPAVLSARVDRTAPGWCVWSVWMPAAPRWHWGAYRARPGTRGRAIAKQGVNSCIRPPKPYASR